VEDSRLSVAKWFVPGGEAAGGSAASPEVCYRAYRYRISTAASRGRRRLVVEEPRDPIAFLFFVSGCFCKFRGPFLKYWFIGARDARGPLCNYVPTTCNAMISLEPSRPFPFSKKKLRQISPRPRARVISSIQG
jgi:hypothetical protein